MLHSYRTLLLSALLTIFSFAACATEVSDKRSFDDQSLRIFVAKKVITMDPTRPVASAVAVRGKQIVSVGSLEDLKPWMDAYPYVIDDTFADKILLPGMIDPHLHPLLGSVMFGTTWITPESWDMPAGKIEAATDASAFWKRLKEALAAEPDATSLFVSWGWSQPTHGPVDRERLDALDTKRPIMIWHRSTHEAVFNTAALDLMGLTVADAQGYSQIDWEKGHFFEAGMFEVAVPRLGSHLLSPEFIDKGYRQNVEYLVSGGITTVGDMATGGLNWDLEMAAFDRNIVKPEAPLRVVMIPDVSKLEHQHGGVDKTFAFVNKQMTEVEQPEPLVGGKRIKLFADGAMFSQLMKVGEPGYIDGHHGEWITPPDTFEALARKYWNAGYRIHVHANGAEGIHQTLDILEKLQLEKPRPPHSLVIEHYGYADDVINRRVAVLGVAVSANPFYVHALVDDYSKRGLGVDRASRISPISGLVDRGVPVALHSDFGLAPARPLFLAWCATTRTTASGKRITLPRGLTLDEALRAITVDAAYILGLEREIGSIQSGKIADFAVLDADPYEVGVEGLKDIGVWGTVFEGQPQPAQP